MKRTGFLIDKNLHGTLLFFVDHQCAKDILPYVFQEKVDKEFKEIRNMLKENLRNDERYRKANVSLKAKKIFEMRFTKNGRNDRIYCQNFSNGGIRFIILIELFVHKKTQEIPKKIKSRIETIGGYQYELHF